MSIKARLQKAEHAAGGQDDPVIVIIRCGIDDDIDALPILVSQGGRVIRRGINTIPAHLRGKPGQIRRIVENRDAVHIDLKWPEDET